MFEGSLSRRDRERLARRTEILNAARAVFAEKGFSRATLEEIAQRAEFGKGTLYNYFEGGKDAILYAILEEVFDQMVDLVESAFDRSTTFRESMNRLFLGFMQLFDERRDLFIILMKEMHRMILSDNPNRADYIHGQHRRIIDSLIPRLENAQADGVIRECDLEALAHTILGNIQGVQLHLCMENCTHTGTSSMVTSEAAADFMTTLLLDGMVIRSPEEAGAAHI